MNQEHINLISRVKKALFEEQDEMFVYVFGGHPYASTISRNEIVEALEAFLVKEDERA